MSRTPKQLVAFLSLGLAVSGCSGFGQSAASSLPSASATSSATAPLSAAPDSASPTSARAKAGSAPPTVSASRLAPAPGRCGASSLRADVVQPPGSGAAGSIYYELLLTNTSQTSCVLAGFPGVSFLNAEGTQIGEPATRDGSGFAALTLPPGQSVSSDLRVSNADNYTDCQPQESATVRVIPPDDATALSSEFVATICSTGAVNTTIGPLHN